MPLPLAHPVSLAVSSVCNLSGCWMNEQRGCGHDLRPWACFLTVASVADGHPRPDESSTSAFIFCPHFLLILPSYLMIRIRWEMVGAGGLARLWALFIPSRRALVIGIKSVL